MARKSDSYYSTSIFRYNAKPSKRGKMFIYLPKSTVLS